MSAQLATEYEFFTEETSQESLFYPDSSISSVKQFKQKLPSAHVSSYLIDPLPKSFSATQTTEQETEILKEPSAPPLIHLSPTHIMQDTFLSLQKWEGIVLEVTEDVFIARLIDLSTEGPDEEAEFSLEEVSQEDRALVKPGALFYWNIGYHDTSRGQRIRSSMIRFRRLPVWQQTEIDEAKRKAQQLRESIGWK